ncbi:MAG: glycine--tRNA ligase subunit alpha [Planctomycetes bacterium]|nr:glycine--tRNA ligase subunit alpha [Planctomycetota bacterium]
MDFQTLIFELQRYWAEQGCVILQPHDQPMGAATFAWPTFLRCLGPEPWRAAHAQPCRRPTDGRYGDNPFRFQRYYQFQVILKPAPEDSQDLYLGSLRRLGIDLSRRDVRFVEDDWESPTLGATGLGWEVWLDGMEVTQYTYFQRMGGRDLDTVCLELTYGLERIAMVLQGKDSAFDLEWVPGVTWGEVSRRNEREASAYNFEHADVAAVEAAYLAAGRECTALLARGLVLPAHERLLDASHNFNLLDARGVIGVNRRAALIGEIRKLSRACADAWLAAAASPGKGAAAAPAAPAPGGGA